jgi:hypothetical protein
MKYSSRMTLTAAFFSLALVVASCAAGGNSGSATSGGIATMVGSPPGAASVNYSNSGRGQGYSGELTRQGYGNDGGNSGDEEGQCDCDGSTTPGLGATN